MVIAPKDLKIRSKKIMKDNKLSKDIDLLFEIGSLRFVNRNWKQYLGLDVANLAEHHFRVVWIALVLAKYENAKNTDKIVKMALLHDLPESRTGDLNKVQKKYVERFENKSIKDILKNSVLEEELIKLWQEYEKLGSIESKIVKDADRLDIDFEMREQKIRGFKFPEKWDTSREKISLNQHYTKTAKKIWKLLQKSDPHHWHLEAGSI